MTDSKQRLLGCPFCGATPHHGPSRVFYDQVHGEPMQNFSIWCPKKHATITASSEEFAIQEWNTRAALAEARGEK